MQNPVILRSKLTVPKLGKDILPRQLMYDLRERIHDYSVCVVTASAGFGKTTLLSQALQSLDQPVAWYTPGPEDDSAYIFFAYLVSALNELIPGISEWYFKRISSQKFAWQRAFEILMSGMEQLSGNEGYLVLDDWQLVSKDLDIVDFMDRFLFCKNEAIRVILISRENIKLPMINRLRAEGRLLEISSAELAFSRQEIEDLIKKMAPNKGLDENVNKIYAYTEGWIMAIKMVLNAKDPSPLIPHSTFSSLFEYLSYSIIEQAGEEARHFLLSSSIPEFFGYQLCQDVLGFPPEFVDKMIRQCLFISEVNKDLYRYHPLFKDFLYRQASRDRVAFKEINKKLGCFYISRNESENALGSFIKAECWSEASLVLNSLSRELVYSDRTLVLKELLKQIPAQYREHPQILLALGDDERFSCAYSAAIGHYRKSEEGFRLAKDPEGISRALRAIGEVYLETLEPKAAEFLYQAYHTLGEGQNTEKAAILELLAENMVNQGKPMQAQRYRLMAEQKQQQEENKYNLKARMLLRTGRIKEAIEVLENISMVNQDVSKIHSTFREVPMLLSTCYNFVGDSEKAIKMANEAIKSGKLAGLSSFEGLGYIRLGHALLIRNPRQLTDSAKAYKEAERLLQNTDVIRVKAELNMGKCLLFALQGEWDKAETIGVEGLQIAQKSQDGWFTGLLTHVLGMSAALCLKAEKAAVYFHDAQASFETCADSLGRCTVYWWLSYLAYLERDATSFTACYERFMDLIDADDYHFLLERPTLFGDIIGSNNALLLQYKDVTREAGYNAPFSADVQVKKGNNLRVYTLGKFRFIRNDQEIPLKDWRRKNALRLFTLFLVKRRSLMNKEEILEYLWPEADIEFAERNLKSAFYNLNKVLEPERKPWGTSHFIQRSGSTYFFNLAADFWYDAEDFLNNVEKAKKTWREDPKQACSLIEYAFSLHHGDFFVGVSMDDWCVEERERIALSYIEAAEILSKIKMSMGQYEEVINLADMILEQDAFWEKAYQNKIICYKKMNNIVMATRTYNQCVQRFKDEMGIDPSPETIRLYQQSI